MNTWHDLVTASLIGTERSLVPAVAIPGLPPVEDDTGDPAAGLLDRAALLTAARRAGRRPDRAEPLPVCEPDPRPMVSPAAAVRLTRILNSGYFDLLDEWLTAVTDRGLRLPPQLLPALLDWALRRRRDPGLACMVAEAGGPRARWLAGLNPDWDFVTAPALSEDEAWRLGDARQRRDYLAALLAREPDAARELIRGGWDAAGPAERGMFLSVLAAGLSPADEPLLEVALNDRDLRSRAADLLARLPGSALGKQAAERALRCVRIEHDYRGPRLRITPPAGDNWMHKQSLLLEVVTRPPLRTWTDELGLTAAQIVALESDDWPPEMLTGWLRAAAAQRDREWTAALIGHMFSGRPPRMAWETQALRELVRQADPELGAPDTLPEPLLDALRDSTRQLVRGAFDVLRFRYDMLKELSDDA